MLKWFSGCKNIDDVKQLYRQLAKEHHPDKGGDTGTMQEINCEYDKAKKAFKNGSYEYSQNHSQQSYSGFADWMDAFKRHQREQERYRQQEEVRRKEAQEKAERKRKEDAKRQAENAQKEDLFSRFKQPQKPKKSKNNSSQMGLF